MVGFIKYSLIIIDNKVPSNKPEIPIFFTRHRDTNKFIIISVIVHINVSLYKPAAPTKVFNTILIIE